MRYKAINNQLKHLNSSCFQCLRARKVACYGENLNELPVDMLTHLPLNVIIARLEYLTLKMPRVAI